RAGRSLALLAGVLTATTGFTVLAAATETSRLTVTGTLGTARVTYDVLVRPAGSRAALEQRRGLVRPNSLTGLYGGVSMAQYAAVGAIAGVEVAAPIAMVGYSIMVAESWARSLTVDVATSMTSYTTGIPGGAGKDGAGPACARLRWRRRCRRLRRRLAPCRRVPIRDQHRS